MAQRTVFVYAANVRWTVECYLFGVCTSKKNMFAILGIRLTRRMPNKPFFARMGHSFGFASVPHASFTFAYRCGPDLRWCETWKRSVTIDMRNTILSFHVLHCRMKAILHNLHFNMIILCRKFYKTKFSCQVLPRFPYIFPKIWKKEWKNTVFSNFYYFCITATRASLLLKHT